MKPALAALLALAPLAACTTLPGAQPGASNNDSAVAQAFLQHIELCDRKYNGAIGAGFAGSFEINCHAISPAQAASLAPTPGKAAPTP